MRDSALNSLDLEKSSEGSSEDIEPKPTINALEPKHTLNALDHSNGLINTSDMPSYYDKFCSTMEIIQPEMIHC